MGHLVGLVLAVVAVDSEQDEETGADSGDRLAVDRDSGLGHPLDDRSHGGDGAPPSASVTTCRSSRR